MGAHGEAGNGKSTAMQALALAGRAVREREGFGGIPYATPTGALAEPPASSTLQSSPGVREATVCLLTNS